MSSREWREVKLGDVVEKIVDNRGKTPPLSKSGRELIETTSIVGKGKYPNYNLISKYVDEETYESWFRNGHPSKGDVLIATVGANIGNAVIMKENRGCIAQNLVALRTNNEIMNSSYLYYYVSQDSVQAKLKGYDIGSAQPNLKVPHLLGLQLSAPSIEEQKAIAATLSCLDDKIELNNRMNKNLEEMAQAIFKNWFVDFEPFQEGEFEESELGMIPKGWRVVSVGDCTSDVTRGITPKYADNTKQYVINQKCIRNKLIDLTLARTHRSSVREDKMVIFGDVLINSTGVGTLGRVAQVYENYENITADSHVTIVRPQNRNLISYLGCLLITKQTYFENSGLGSTGQTELSRDVIKDLNVVLPNDEVLEEFTRIYNQIYTQITLNQKENNNLFQIRDTLLPKLMSGEVRVPYEEVI